MKGFQGVPAVGRVLTDAVTRGRKGLDISVIGAGVVGLATALELSAAGMRVRLHGGTELTPPASWAGGGLLAPIHPWQQPPALEALAEWNAAHYPAWVRRLAAQSGVDSEWRRNGLLAFDLSHEAEARAWARRQRRMLEVLDAERVQQLDPAARAAPALWVADAGQVRNPRLLKALAIAVGRAGVECRSEAVSRVVCEDGWVRGVNTATGFTAAEVVVICAGAWSAGLCPGVPAPPIIPMRGQMLMYELPPERAPQRNLLDAGRYLIPRVDGRVLCGSTVESVGFANGTTGEAAASLAQSAAALCPRLQDLAPVAHWSGLRPGSADGLPYMGAHPEVAGLYVNSGHFRNGILFAPGSARLLADLILDRTPAFDPAAFRLAGRMAD